MATDAAVIAKVKEFQKSLGVKADGIIGPNTIRALQKRVGVPQDGKLGPQTRAAAAKAGITIPSATAVAAINKAAAKAPATSATPKPTPVVAKAAPIPKALLAAVAAPSLPPLTSAVNTQALVASIPEPARAFAADSLQQLAQMPDVSMSDVDRLVAGLTSTMAPQLTAILEALKQREAAKQATGESNELLLDAAQQRAQDSQWNANQKNWELNAEQWASNATAQGKILEAIAALASRVTAQNAFAKRTYQAYGIPL